MWCYQYTATKLIQNFGSLLCVSGIIPRLSLIQHSLYVGVVEKSPPPPLTGEQYGNMELKYPEGGHCQSVLCLRTMLEGWERFWWAGYLGWYYMQFLVT